MDRNRWGVPSASTIDGDLLSGHDMPSRRSNVGLQQILMFRQAPFRKDGTPSPVCVVAQGREIRGLPSAALHPDWSSASHGSWGLVATTMGEEHR